MARSAGRKGKYQLFDALRPEEYAALEKDILARGVMVPVEIDENGATLDGHHRVEIAGRHKLKCPTITRKFKTEQEKREHVIKLNLARRHLEPWQWGQAFKLLLEERGVKRGRGKNQGELSETVSECAAELGVEERTARNRLKAAHDYEALAKPKQREVKEDRKPLTQAVREVNQQKAQEAVGESAKLSGKYRVFYADPPWQYGNKGLTEYGHAESHYPTTSTKDLAGLPVKDLAHDNAVLFLWATAPMLPDALQVIAGWGFSYKTCMVWDKVKHNFGHYVSVRHELLLIATRGSCTPDVKKLFDSVQTIERTKQHSAKPEQFRKIIQTLYTKGRKIELFARKETKGWKTWGNQLPTN